MFPHIGKNFWLACIFSGLGTLTLSASSALAQIFTDGIYLYGQVPQAEQIGQEYLVFQVRAGKIRGGVYYPASEYNCFAGTVTGNQLILSVVDPQDNRVYPYPVALVPASPLASGQVSTEVKLAGYHRLENLSAVDRKILEVCGHPKG
jgi:hypothetical protein